MLIFIVYLQKTSRIEHCLSVGSATAKKTAVVRDALRLKPCSSFKGHWPFWSDPRLSEMTFIRLMGLSGREVLSRNKDLE